MPATKTVISFGLVAIPVAMHTATQSNDISFNQLHEADKSRIKYKKVCSHCGQEVSQDDIIKGYQYDKDHYVTVSDEEIEAIKTEKEKSIQILQFAQLDQISPVYYDKSYYVLPEAGGDKAYELLRQALMDSQKVAVGKTVLGSHETLMVIIPRADGLVIQTMFFADEVKEIPKKYQKQEVTAAELKMASALIASMDEPFNPEAYHDEYQAKLRQLIEDKIAKREIAVPKSEAPSNIIDLMEALQKSVEQTGKTKAKVTKKAAPKAAPEAPKKKQPKRKKVS